LILSGALDRFGYSRRALFTAADRVLEAGIQRGKSRASGQLNLFMAIEMDEPEPEIERLDEYEPAEKLRLEYEMLGLYLSGHPLEPYKKIAERYRCDAVSAILGGGENGYQERQPVKILGRIAAHRTINTKKGRPMAFITVDDGSAEIEAVIFPELCESVSPMLHTGRVVLIEGTFSQEEEKDPKILAVRMLDADTLPQTDRILHIRVDSAEDPRIPQILRLLQREPGIDEARLFLADRKKVVLPKGIGGVDAGKRLIEGLERIVGNGNVRVK
jgi:DNA polymerase-3 subunit alpha